MPFFTDNFTGTDATQLQSHTPDTGTSWTRLWGTNAANDLEINGNACRPDANVSAAGLIYTGDATPPSANYDVTFTVVTNTALGSAHVMVRLQDQGNMYSVRLLGGTGTCQLYKKVSGTWTALGSTFDCPANGSVCKLEINGTALKFYDDGAEVASATVSDISAAGKLGLGGGGGAELPVSGDALRTGWRIDTLSGNDLGGGSSPQTISPSSIASAEALGSDQVNLNLVGQAIASVEAFGTLAMQPGPVTVSPSAIGSAEAFGAAQLNLTISGTGIAGAEAFGSATITPGAVTISPSSIAGAEAFGDAVVGVGAITIVPSGVASAEAFGTAALQPGAVTISPSGVASAEAFGTVTLMLLVTPSGVAGGEAFGATTVTVGTATISPPGVASAESFGQPDVAGGAGPTPTPTPAPVVFGQAGYAPIERLYLARDEMDDEEVLALFIATVAR